MMKIMRTTKPSSKMIDAHQEDGGGELGDFGDGDQRPQEVLQGRDGSEWADPARGPCRKMSIEIAGFLIGGKFNYPHHCVCICVYLFLSISLPLSLCV